MPLDVLGQLQEASANVDNEQLKSALDNVIQSASQSEAHLDALRAIMSALTQGGNQLSGSLDKVVFYFEKFEERTNAAKNAMFGFGNSIQSLDTKSLNDVNSLLIKIENQQKSLSQKINFFPNVKESLNHLNQISQELINIQKSALKGVDINVNYSGAPKIQKEIIKGQAFSKGGAVSYNPSNSRKAKTGGQFVGKRKGDREIAFVNAGQAIITQRAVKSGARQSGMSVGSYISHLNSGNISKIKRGRSFADGGGIGRQTEINNLQQKTKKGGVETRQSGDELKNTINELKSVFENYAKKNGGSSADSVDKIFDLLKSGSLSKKVVGYIQQRLKIDGKLNIDQLKNSPELISDLIDQLDEMSGQIESGRKKILTFKDAIQDYGDQAEKNLKRGIQNIPILGKWALDTNNKMLLLGAGIAMVGQQLPKLLGSFASWTVKQSELNKSMSQFSATANTFGTSTSSLTRFKDEMNLTRQQAAQLTDTFRTVGIEGNVSFSQIQTLAAGIKDQFGKLDITLLKDAVNLIKDIPKQQVDVLIKGTGSFDDTGNLIANLIQGGNLQATAQIIAKGGFGAVQGVTPQMSESDKKTIEMQEKMNQWLDDIYAMINNFLPDSAKQLAVIGTAVSTLAVPLLKAAGSIITTATGVGQLAMASSGTHIRVHDIAGGGSLGGGSLGGGLGGKKGGITRLPAIMRKYGGRGAGKLGQSIVKGGGSLVKGLGSVATKIGSVIGSTLAAAGPYLAIATVLYGIGEYVKGIADEMKKKEQEDRRRSSAMNMQKYGVALDTHVVSDEDRSKKRSATVGGQAVKGAAIGGGAGALAGAVIGSVIPGLGTAIGAGIGFAVGSLFGGIFGADQGSKEADEEDALVEKENAAAKEAQKAIALLEKNERDKIAALNGLGIATVDVKKSILSLAPIMKRIQMYAKGAYSQADRQRAATAQAQTNLGMRAGGSSATIFQSAQSSFNFSRSAFKTERIVAEQERQKIKTSVKNGSMGVAQAQQALLTIKQQQIKKLNELIDAMERSTIDFRKLPQYMSASMTQNLSSFFANLNNNSFIGDSSTNADLAIQVLKNGQLMIQQAQQTHAHNVRMADQYHQQAKSFQDEQKAGLNSAAAEAKRQGVNIAPGQGETDEERIYTGITSHVTNFLNDYQRALSNDPQAMALQNTANDIKGYASTISQRTVDIGTMSNEDYKGMSQEARENYKKQSIEEARAAIARIREAQQYMSADQRAQSNKEIEAIQAAISDLNSKDTSTGSEKEQRELRASLNNLTAKVTHSSAVAQSHAQEKLIKNNRDFVYSLGGEKKARAEFALMQQHASYTAAQNTSRQVEMKKQESLLLLFSQYEAQAKKFADAVALVYKSANIMYRDILAKNLSKTERIRAYSVGGAQAMAATAQAQSDTIISELRGFFDEERAIKQGMATSQSTYDKNIGQVQDGDLKTYFELLKAENEAKEVYRQNPQNQEARLRFMLAQQKRQAHESKLGGATKIQEKVRKDQASQEVYSSLIMVNQALNNHSNKYAQLIQKFGENIDKFHEAVNRAIESDYNFQQARTSTQRSVAQGRLAEQRVDVSGMHQYVQQIGDLTREEYRIKMQVMEQSIRLQTEKLRRDEAKLQEELAAERAKGSSDVARIQAQLNGLRRARFIKQKQAQTNRIKMLTQMSQQLARNIAQSFQALLGVVDRKQQSLEIQKDLLSTIGAPFEMILDIQQQMIGIYRQKAEIQQQHLNELIANKASQKSIEQQKLKTAKAQAQVLKAAFGAQRDSLDKMLGKMMGTFDQVGGIFGPDGQAMMARKFGQGYAVNGVGMAVTADPNQSHNSFKQRAMANSRVAMHGNTSAQSIMNGHQPYSPQRISSPDGQVSSALGHTQDVINTNEMDVRTQRVSNLIIDGSVSGNIPGASKGGYVWGGKIRAFSQGGPSDPRDNIPALLRRGQFVLTPEDVTNAVNVGKQFENAFVTSSSGGTGDNSTKILSSILGVVTNINKIVSSTSTTLSTSAGGQSRSSSSSRERRNPSSGLQSKQERETSAGQQRFRRQQQLQQEYLGLSQQVMRARSQLSGNPSSRQKHDNLAAAMQRLEQFLDNNENFRMGSSGDNTVDFSADIARYRQDRQDLSQLSIEQLTQRYNRERRKTDSFISRGIGGVLLQSQREIEEAVRAQLSRRSEASRRQSSSVSSQQSSSDNNNRSQGQQSSEEESQIYFKEPQTPEGIKRLTGRRETPFSSVRGAGFQISMSSLMDGSAQQYIRDYEAAQKEYDEAQKAKLQIRRSRTAQGGTAQVGIAQGGIAQGGTAQGGGVIGVSPDRMVTDAQRLRQRIRQAYRAAGAVTMGDVKDTRLQNERRRKRKSDSSSSSQSTQEDVLLDIAEDVHEILQILRGDYKQPQPQPQPQDNQPHIGPREAPDPTRHMAGGGVKPSSYVTYEPRYYYKSRERGPDFTSAHKLLGNIGLSKNGIRVFFHSFKKFFSGTKQILGKIGNWSKGKIKQGVAWTKDKFKQMKINFEVGRMGVKGGFVAGLGDKYQRMLNGLTGLKEAFVRGMRGESASSDKQLLLGNQSILKSIFGSGIFKGIANLAGQGVGAIGDLSKTIVNSINKSFLVQYTKQMLRSQIKGLKLSFQRGAQGKSVSSKFTHDNSSWFKRTFGKGFWNGMANVLGKTIRFSKGVSKSTKTGINKSINYLKDKSKQTKGSYFRGKAGIDSKNNSSKFQQSVNSFGKFMGSIDKITQNLRQSVFGSLSQKQLNKRAAFIFKNQNPNFFKSELSRKRSEAAHKQAQRLLSKHGNKYTEGQALRKAYRRYDRGVLKDENGVALKDLHKLEVKQDAKRRFENIKENIKTKSRQDSLVGKTKNFVQDNFVRFITGKVSDKTYQKMYKRNRDKYNSRGFEDDSKVNANLTRYANPAVARAMQQSDPLYKSTMDSKVNKILAEEDSVFRGRANDNVQMKYKNGFYNSAIKQRAHQLRLEHRQKHGYTPGAKEPDFYKQAKDQILNNEKEFEYKQNRSSRGKELRDNLHDDVVKEVRERFDFLAKKETDKNLQKYSLKGIRNRIGRKLSAGKKRSPFLRGFKAAIQGKDFKDQKGIRRKLGYWAGKPARWVGNIFRGGANFVRGFRDSFRGGQLSDQNTRMGKLGWYASRPAYNFGRGLRSLVFNERHVRYNSAGQIIGRGNRNNSQYISRDSLNWGQRARLNFSAGYNGYNPLSRGISYRAGQFSKFVSPVVRPIARFGRAIYRPIARVGRAIYRPIATVGKILSSPIPNPLAKHFNNFSSGYHAGLSGGDKGNGFWNNAGYFAGKASPHVSNVGSALLGINQILDAYAAIKQANKNGTPVDYDRVMRGILGGSGGLLRSAGGAFKNKHLGRIGNVLSIASSVPGMFAQKNKYDEYGNFVGKQWDAYNASYAMQNLVSYALPMKAGFGSSIAPYAAVGQGIGNLMIYAANNMEDGEKKEKMLRAGNFLAGSFGFLGDVATTMSTGGLNKVVDLGFEMWRLYGTDQGRQMREYLGQGEAFTNSLLSASGLKYIDQALGTKFFSAYDQLFNVKLTNHAIEMNKGAFIKNRYNKQTYRNNADIQALYNGSDDQTELDAQARADKSNRAIEKYERQRMKVMAQLSAEHHLGKQQTNTLLHSTDMILNQSDSNNSSQIRQGFYNDFNAIKQKKASQASEKTSKIRAQVSSYDNDLATYNAMTEQQKASEQGRRLQQSISDRASTIDDKRLQLQKAENNERVVKAQSEVFSSIMSNVMGSEQQHERLKGNLRKSSAKLKQLQTTKDESYDYAVHQEEHGFKNSREEATVQAQKRQKDVAKQREVVRKDAQALLQSEAKLQRAQVIIPQVLEAYRSGNYTRDDLITLAEQTGTELTQEQVFALTGRDKEGNLIVSQKSQEETAQFYAKAAKKEQEAAAKKEQEAAERQRQQQEAERLRQQFGGIVDVGKKDDIGTNVHKILRILQQRLGGQNPYLAKKPASSVADGSGFLQGNSLSYSYETTIDRDYADLDQNDAWTLSAVWDQTNRQLQYYNDKSGVFSKNYKGDRFGVEAKDNSNLQYQQSSAVGNGSQNSRINITLTIEPNEFSNLLRQKAVEIVRWGMTKNGSGLTT